MYIFDLYTDASKLLIFFFFFKYIFYKRVSKRCSKCHQNVHCHRALVVVLINLWAVAIYFWRRSIKRQMRY